MTKYVDIIIILLMLALFALGVYEVFFDIAPRDVAKAYCRANGYERASNYEFTDNTFFVNCTDTMWCASNQECIRKNGMMKE